MRRAGGETMKMIRTRVCGAILSLWWLAGCGGSSANLGGFSSSIDGNAVIGQLTPQQQQTLCGEIASFSKSSGFDRDATDLFCREAGILAAYLNAPDAATDAQLRALCQTNYDMCTSMQSAGTCEPPTGACTATVAEFSACVNDTVETLPMELEDVPTCDKISAAQLTSTAPPAPPTQPPSCASYQAKCPGGSMM
jgi:hypothetical protein